MDDWDSDEPLIPKSARRHEANFDITAMIDLVFMMNIFFLVTTVAAAQLEIDLPSMRHAIPTDPDDALVISISGQTPPAVEIELAGKVLDSGVVDADQQKESAKRAANEASRSGKHVILLRAERSVKLRDIKRISGAAVEGGREMELRFAVIEKDAFP